MEAVKYNYGTTPEEVIRERAVQFTVRGPLGAMPTELDPSALLTVLDALWARSVECAACTGHGAIAHMGRRDLTKNPCNDCFGPRTLRIQILAALGIDES